MIKYARERVICKWMDIKTLIVAIVTLKRDSNSKSKEQRELTKNDSTPGLNRERFMKRINSGNGSAQRITL